MARHRDYVNTGKDAAGIVKAPSQSLAGWHPGPSYNIQRPRLVVDPRTSMVGVTWKYVELPNGSVRPLEVHSVTEDFVAILKAMDAIGARTMTGR